MATPEQLEQALRNADAAGDVQAARALAAEIVRVRGGAAPAQAPAAAKPIDPSEGSLPFRPFGIDTGLQMPQGVSRFLAGAGKSMVDVGRGAGQMLGLVDRQSIDEVHRLDNPLTNTGAGIAGGIAGNVAMTLPAVLAGPVGATIGAQAALGAAQGALQPVGTDESRLKNIAVGGAVGAALPAALRAAKVLKAGLIDPFTDAGRTKIVGGAINRAAADAQAAEQAMRNASGATPGFSPTAGQAANDSGIAALERTGRAIDPAGFGDIDMQQRAALIDALRGVAKTPEARGAAVEARKGAVNALYDEAKAAVVPADDVLTELLKRPSMSAAKDRAAKLAAERGQKFAMTAGAPEQPALGGLLDMHGNPLAPAVPATPATITGKALQDIKMGLDDAIGAPGLGGMQGAERAAALDTMEAYKTWLAGKIPAYAQANKVFSEMSRPVNQMEIGQELYNRFVPALADNAAVPFRSRAASYAQALREGDQLAANVTGFKAAKLDKIMTPEQMATLRGVLKDSQSIAAAQDLGRGVGSDTVQKMAMSNLIEQAGLPSWIGALAPLRPLGGWAQTAGNLLYKSNDERMRHLLADVLKDPKQAAAAMKAAGVTPSQYAELLRAMGAGANQALPAAAVQGNE